MTEMDMNNPLACMREKIKKVDRSGDHWKNDGLTILDHHLN